jgi:hypothetical protein
MESQDGVTSGWVSANYLSVDTSGPATNPLVAEAVALVRHVYDLRQSARSTSAVEPLNPSVARDYFFADVVESLRHGNLGADPLFGAQDSEITDLQVFAAPDQAMLRGMISVHASFRNFGQPQKAVFRLRVDTSLDDPALRIMRVEHDGWEFP